MAKSTTTSSATTTAASSVLTSTQLAAMFSHPLATKLNNANFLPWRQLAMAALRGNRIDSFVQNRNSSLVEFLTDADKVAGKVNDAFIAWTQIDQLLVYWFLESMAPEIQTQMVGCVTSFDIWETIERLFSSKFKARIMQFKLQLQTTKKGDSSMADYLAKMKNIIDTLAVAGQASIIDTLHVAVVETRLSLLAQAFMPLRFWDEAYVSVTFLINKLPTLVLNNISPWEKLYGKSPNYNFLKVFGSRCYPHTRPYNKNKLMYRSVPCTFLGYSNRYKGYKCLGDNGRLYIARNVIFDEHSFPFVGSTRLSSSCMHQSDIRHHVPILHGPPTSRLSNLPTIGLRLPGSFSSSPFVGNHRHLWVIVFDKLGFDF